MSPPLTCGNKLHLGVRQKSVLAFSCTGFLKTFCCFLSSSSVVSLVSYISQTSLKKPNKQGGKRSGKWSCGCLLAVLNANMCFGLGNGEVLSVPHSLLPSLTASQLCLVLQNICADINQEHT